MVLEISQTDFLEFLSLWRSFPLRRIYFLVTTRTIVLSRSWTMSSKITTMDISVGHQHNCELGSSLEEGGHGGGGHGEALEHAGEEGGRDAEGSRHEGRRGEPETFNFRFLQPFRLRSPVLEPDFHLQIMLSVLMADEDKEKKDKDKNTNKNTKVAKLTCVSVSFS